MLWRTELQVVCARCVCEHVQIVGFFLEAARDSGREKMLPVTLSEALKRRWALRCAGLNVIFYVCVPCVLAPSRSTIARSCSGRACQLVVFGLIKASRCYSLLATLVSFMLCFTELAADIKLYHCTCK